MAPQDRIELVVFDVDGVLAHLDPARRLALLSRYAGKSAEFLHQALYASDFERNAEAGAFVPGSEYLAELNRRIAGALTREQWIAARRAAMTPIPEALSVARKLSDRVRIATLTNNGSLFKESIAELLPDVADLFGAGFHASFEFGARKPDPLVFRRLAERFDLDAGQVLFIDDDPEYIAGARSAGMKTVWCRQTGELAGQLGMFGLECERDR